MTGALFAVPALTLLFGFLIAAIVWVALDRKEPHTRDLELRFPKLADMRADTVRIRMISFGIGLVAAGACAFLGDNGLGLLLAPTVLALVMIVGLRVQEFKHSKAASDHRVASLTGRRAVDYLRPVTGATLAFTVVAFAWVVIAGEIFGDDAGAGRARNLSLQCADYASSTGPFPGSFYTRPMLVGAVILAGVGAWAVIAIVRRPRDARPDVVDIDDSLRVEATQGVMSAIVVGIGLQVAGASFFATGAFARIAGSQQMCPIPTSYSVAHWLYACALVVAIVVVVIAGKRYFIPTAANHYLTKAGMMR